MFPFQTWIDNQWKDSFSTDKLEGKINLTLWYRPWSLMILDRWLDNINIPHKQF